MLNKELKAGLAILGAMVPFVVQADQPMSEGQTRAGAKQPTHVAGEKVKEGQMPAGYNHSAAYMIDSGWDLYLTADYIYWHLNREDYGVSQTNSYKSGFQVGLGFNMAGMDNWDVFAEYTWYRNNRDNNVQKFAYDDLVVTLDRPFYLGKKLTANFALGLRGLWIDNTSGSYEQKSWALGPRFGFESNWLLGGGFRIFGNVSESILYTSYTKASGVLASGSDLNTLRAVTDSCLGLGWGSYFGETDDFHFDLTVGYDFNIHWNQHLGGEEVGQNIYLHGLNIGMRLDF